MPLYRYVKVYPKHKTRTQTVLPLFFMMAGFFLLFWATWPILSFKIFNQDVFAGIVTPIQINKIANGNSDSVLAVSDVKRQDSFQNYTNPNMWYPAQPQKKVPIPVNTYQISIPKLKIIDAQVMVAGDSLEKSLIHYGGTGLPGEFGNSVIFGHSTLPQLYDPLNYRTIFSLLPTLKPSGKSYKGDEIYITYDGITYKYLIFDMTVTKPNDLTPLEQHYDDSYITLITCVPPGTYWERLNVKAKLVPIL